MSSKRNILTLKEKIEVINCVEKNCLSTRAAALKFNISKSQSAAIIKNKDVLKSMWCTNKSINTKKRLVATQSSSIDKVCYEWFSKARIKNLPLSGPLIKAKAMEIAQQLDIKDFKASNGWLDKWKKRNNISYKSITGEAADVNLNDVHQFKEKLPSLLLGYDPKNVYNADETGLFFRALPQKTFSFKTDKCIGGKLAKERLTILFCGNMAGTLEQPLVIGKSAKPRAFKNVHIHDLPAIWKSNKKAWMNTEIMTEWLQEFDRKMKRENRKILLFLDNAASHPRNIRLDNIKIIYLPPNCTAICQPLDQGIIKNFKFHYRALILKHVLTKIDMNSTENASDLAKSINILEALYFIRAAWKKISDVTIKNCFRKAGFVIHEESQYESEDDLPLSKLISDDNRTYSHEIAENVNTIFEINAQDLNYFTDFDSDIFTEDISLCKSPENINIESSSEEEMEEDMEAKNDNQSSIHTISEALKVLQSLKEFSKNDYYAFAQLKNVETYYTNHLITQKNATLRQSTMDTFLK